MKTELYWEIPVSIDLEGFLKEHPPPFRYKIDHFYYIVDYLVSSMEMQDMDANAGYVNLNARKLQAVNHNYKKYLDHLLGKGFLRINLKYMMGDVTFLR